MLLSTLSFTLGIRPKTCSADIRKHQPSFLSCTLHPDTSSHLNQMKHFQWVRTCLTWTNSRWVLHVSKGNSRQSPENDDAQSSCEKTALAATCPGLPFTSSSWGRALSQFEAVVTLPQFHFSIYLCFGLSLLMVANQVWARTPPLRSLTSTKVSVTERHWQSKC